MGGKRRLLPSTCLLKLHLPCTLSDVPYDYAKAVGCPADESWIDARFIGSGSSLEIAGPMTTAAVTCHGLEALYALIQDTNSQASTVLRYSAVRFPPSARKFLSDGHGPALEVAAFLPPRTAQLWAELEVKVTPNAHLCSSPGLRATWRVLLPWLVTCTRAQAPTAPTASNSALSSDAAGFGRTPNNSSSTSHAEKTRMQVLALEAVYSSLEPGTTVPFMAEVESATSAVEPGSEASGLNALPTAVVMKAVALYLSAASLEALSSTCKEQRSICAELIPGLELDLFPHQSEGVRWMRDRERGRRDRPHPEFVEITAPSATQDVEGYGGGGQESNTSTRKLALGSDRRWVNVVDGMVSAETPTPCPPVRGGMLCDEPGLGKTITVLALLLRTRGLLPAAAPVPTVAATTARSGSGTASRAQWQNWGRVERQTAMMKVVRALQLNDPAALFSRLMDQDALQELGMPDYLATVDHPIDLQTIAKRASSGPRDALGQYADFEEFSSDIRRVFSNAILYHGHAGAASAVVDSVASDSPNSNSPVTDPNADNSGNVVGQTRARAIPGVADTAEKLSGLAEELLRGVFVGRRVDRSEVLAERLRALKPTSATLIVVPPPMLPHWRNQLISHAQPGRLGKLFFDERSDLPLPAVEELTDYGVVITTYQRLTNEQPRWGDSPMARIYWLRMVLDEGHAMGSSALTSCGDVARRVEAERRWVMTGTPTPTTSADAALRNLSNLLSFLREKEYSPDWRRSIRGPFMANKFEGRKRLRTLLSEIMIRHTKKDVLAIPPPIRDSALLNMSKQETLAYDTIVSFVRSNLLLTSMEGKTSGWQDSLLNPANTKYAMEALTNIRLSCCGGGTLVPVVKRHHHIETLDMLRDIHAVHVVDLRRIDNFISRATTGEISSCQGCGEPLQLLHVTPCAHLICVDCVDRVNNACGVCRKPYDVDDFQRIQPGFELTWMYNIREQEKLHQQRRAAARLQRRGSAQANTVQPNGSASGVVVVPPPSSPSAGGGSSGGGAVPASPGLDGMDEEDEEELEMHSKAFHAIGQLRAIQERAPADRQRRDYRPLKAIVFSQFLPVLNIVGDKFLREFGGFPEKGWHEKGEKCVAEFWGKNRAKELERFRTDPACFVLLLGKRGAHGLDLSFVTHMFLMDQIWDRSLETQVIARANRMGAKGSVSVVQLIMKDTMEQELRSYVNNNSDTPSTSGGKTVRSKSQGTQNRSPASEAAAATVASGSPPSSPRKPSKAKSPWEAVGKKRARSRGQQRRGPPSSGNASASVQQEHAKVHFLLTSLRSSRSAAEEARKVADETIEGGEEEEEQEFNERLNGKGKGRGNGKGKPAGDVGIDKKGKDETIEKAVRRRGVTFADTSDHEDGQPQQQQARSLSETYPAHNFWGDDAREASSASGGVDEDHTDGERRKAEKRRVMFAEDAVGSGGDSKNGAASSST